MIWGDLHQTFNGRSPPVSFYVSAWASTIKTVCEAVNTNNQSLKEAVRAQATWIHYWTVWSPPGSVAADSNLATHSKAPPATKPERPGTAAGQDSELAKEVARLQTQCRSMQSQRDKAERSLRDATNRRRRSRSQARQPLQRQGRINQWQDKQYNNDKGGNGCKGGGKRGNRW